MGIAFKYAGIAAFTMLIMLSGCGQTKHGSLAGPAMTPIPAGQEISLDGALEELDGISRPDGVEETLWGELKEELRKALETNASDGKIVSKPPTGEANRVTDLTYIELDSHPGSFDLQWSYKNVGDYNQDGTVNISDVSPLAAHFGQTVDETNSWIDGNEDGIIGIADIQPFAANYGSEINRYCSEHATRDGEFEYLGSISFYEVRQITAVPRKPEMNHVVHHSWEAYDGFWRYRIVPIDSQGNPGEPSEELFIGESAEIGPAGGSLEYADGSIRLTIPPGAIAAPTSVSIRKFQNDYRMPCTSGPSCVISPVDFELNLPAELTVEYEVPDAPYPEEKLTISKYAGDSSPIEYLNNPGYRWLGVDCSLDLENESITGSVGSFGYFAVSKMPNESSCVVNGPYFEDYQGTYAYAVERGFITVYDNSQPQMPELISHTPTAVGSLRGYLSIEGDYAFYQAGGWLACYEVSDPLNVKGLGSVWIGGASIYSVSDIAVVNRYAYITLWNDGLVIADLTNPDAPVVCSRLQTPTQVYRIGVAGGYAYLGISGNLCVVDVSNPASPSIVATLPGVGYMRCIHVNGDYVYCGTSHDELVVVDVSNPENPQIVGSYPCQFDLSVMYKVALSGSTLYLPSNDIGVQVIDVSDPTQPLLQDTISTPYKARTVRIEGSTAFIGCSENSGCTLIVPLAESPEPEPASWIQVPGGIRQMDLEEDYICIATENASLQIADISIPQSPAIVGSLSLPDSTTLVSSNGDYAAVWASDLYVVDVRNKSNPTLVGSYICDLLPEKMFLSGNRVYFMGWWPEQGLQSQSVIIFDISNPSHPSLLWAGRPNDGLSIFSFFVKDDCVYTGGLIIYDFTDTTSPLTLCDLDLSGQALDIFVESDSAYITNYRGLQIIDISDRSNPIPVGLFGINERHNNVRVSGNRACVQNWPSMMIVDVSVPSNPFLIGDIGKSQWDSEFALSGDYIYVSTGGGILAKDISTL